MASSVYSPAFTVASDITSVVGIPNPDDGGTTWTAIQAVRDVSGHFTGTDKLIDTSVYTGSDSTSFIPPIAVNPVNETGSALMGAADGTAFRRLDVGDGIAVQIPVQQVASGNWPVATNFLHVALTTCCDVNNPAKGEITVSAADNATGTLTVDAGDIGDCTIGRVLACTVDSVVYYATIVANDTVDTITLHPRVPDPAGAIGTADYRLCVSYTPKSGSPSADDLVYLRCDMSGLTHYALNCAVGQVQFELDGDSGGLLATVLLRPADGVVFQGNNSGANSYSATIPSTLPALDIQSCYHYTAALASPIAEPTSLDASDLTLAEGWNFTVDFNRSYPQSCGGISREGAPNYTRSEVTFTGTTETVSPFLTWLPDREQRTVVLGFGPPKRGCALIINSAHLREGEAQGAVDETETRTVDFSMRNGTFTGESDGTGFTWVFAVPYNAS